MAPKRKVVSVKKVVKQTVQVSVLETNNAGQTQTEFDELTTVTTTTTAEKEEPLVKKTIPEEEAQAAESKPKSAERNVPKEAGISTTEEKPKPKRKKKRSKSGVDREEYKRYVFRVLKQVHPGMAISGKDMTIVNNMMSDMFQRLADEAGKLSAYTKKATLSAREVQGAATLVLPGDLGKQAVAEGTKAVTAYMSEGSTKPKPKPKAKKS